MSASILRVESIARDGCLAAGGGRLLEPDGAHVILQALRKDFGRDSLDAVFQDVVRSSHFKRTAQIAGKYTFEFDLLRSKAGGRMQPDASAAEL